MKKTKLTKMVYIMSCYTSRKPYPLNKIEEYLRYRAVTSCIGALHDKYPYAFIGPITQSHNTGFFTKTKTGGFEHWEAIDLTFISRCDECWLFMNEGWQKSKGVRAELEFCFDKKIPIRLIDPKTYKVRRLKNIRLYYDISSKDALKRLEENHYQPILELS